MRYKNFLSTGDYFTEITLNEYPTTLVLGENGSGKSTMLDALTFVLFSKPFRKINKPQLVNTINESGLLVEVEFFIGRLSPKKSFVNFECFVLRNFSKIPQSPDKVPSLSLWVYGKYFKQIQKHLNL